MNKTKKKKINRLLLAIGVWCLRRSYTYYGLVMGMEEPSIAIFYNNKKTWHKIWRLLK